MEDFKFNRFIPIAKVDAEERMVYGFASTPDLDSDGEIISLEGLQKALPEYLQFPTLREMHQPKVAGTVKNTEIKQNGALKGLYIGAKVVADDAWKMVKEGVYRGFSIGGNVVSKVGNIIEELSLVEISLVDVPANKKAKIEVWKAGKVADQFEKVWNDMMMSDDLETLNKLIKSLDSLSFEKGSAPEILREVVKINMAKQIEKHEEIEADVKEVETPEVKEEAVESTESSETEVKTEVEEKKEEGVKAEGETETETEAEVKTEEAEVEEKEEPKEAKADPEFEKLDAVNDKLEKLAKEIEVADLSKANSEEGFKKVVSAVEKMSTLLEGIDARLKKVEAQPAPLKSKQAYVELKKSDVVTEDKQVEDKPEIAQKKARLAELVKIMDTVGRSEFAKQGFSLEAAKLQDELAKL